MGYCIPPVSSLDSVAKAPVPPVSGIRFDPDSNLLSFVRNGPTGSWPYLWEIDSLIYSISGNRLNSVIDHGTRADYALEKTCR